MRGLTCAVFVVLLGTSHGADAAEAWTLDSQTDANGKVCSLSRMDDGRPFSITLAFVPDTRDQAVVRLSFNEPKLMQGAKKALATLEFDNGASQSHRVELAPSGTIQIPIVALGVEDVLQTFSQSENLTVATRFGSTSFSLAGIADRLPALRDCAGG
ncbi:MAG TPA: hypothetical protein VJ790_13215 [Dongiaceae bacterium]|nr:hypothetical protein [Dongiaceae bacterium]